MDSKRRPQLNKPLDDNRNIRLYAALPGIARRPESGHGPHGGSETSHSVLILPSEIVSEIFIHTLPIHPHPPMRGKNCALVSLTQICRKWREIALATPRLWRAILLSYNTGRPLKRQISNIKLWVERARSCPLSIFFSGGLNATHLLASITPQRSRWERLDLDISPHDLAAIKGDMPLLRHLRLTLEDGFRRDEVSEGDRETFSAAVAPLLRSVELNHHAATRLLLPWAQITSLKVTLEHVQECVTILGQASESLVHCDLCIRRLDRRVDDSADYTGSVSISLPRLESLVLSRHASCDRTPLLKLFDAPGLRRLEVSEAALGLMALHFLTTFLLSRYERRLEEVSVCGILCPASKEVYRKALSSCAENVLLPYGRL
ncbi:F-box domain-containing protein [Favolaschia claudopus]|uniref:F-box domain-containing protein n=1 Tax=Favolaschia claudopus TaxID=2862362 RepID=A0AAW0EE79_9AGAR